MDVLELAPLVHRLARAVRRRLPFHGCTLDEDDLRQVGWLAVLVAADRGNLETLSPRRIVGAMLDELARCEHHGMTRHKADGAPRGRHCKRARVDAPMHCPLDDDEMQLGSYTDPVVRLRDDALTPREELVLMIYADAEGNRTRAVERAIGGRVHEDIQRARAKLEALAA